MTAGILGRALMDEALRGELRVINVGLELLGRAPGWPW
jgi:hypothetical protein